MSLFILNCEKCPYFVKYRRMDNVHICEGLERTEQKVIVSGERGDHFLPREVFWEKTSPHFSQMMSNRLLKWSTNVSLNAIEFVPDTFPVSYLVADSTSFTVDSTEFIPDQVAGKGKLLRVKINDHHCLQTVVIGYPGDPGLLQWTRWACQDNSFSVLVFKVIQWSLLDQW